MKKLIALALTLVLSLSLAACGGSSKETVNKKITVAASPTPHAEILAVAKDILAAKGIELEIKEFTDYVQPNNVVDSGEIDANYFQHQPYLDDFNAQNGTKVVSVGAIHVEPMGVYGGKQTSLDAIDGATIAIPNDTTNEARALMLLENLGCITLKEGAGITATPLDIAENPHNITFNEVEAAQLPNVLRDVDFAVINSNYALDGGLNPAKDALGVEGSFSAYSNILCVKEGRENEPLVKALLAALQSQQVADFIAEKYDGAVLSVVDNPTDGYDASVDYSVYAK